MLVLKYLNDLIHARGIRQIVCPQKTSGRRLGILLQYRQTYRLEWSPHEDPAVKFETKVRSPALEYSPGDYAQVRPQLNSATS